MKLDVAALAHLVAGQLEVEAAAVSLDAHFVRDLGADRVRLTDVMLALEEHFDVEIANDDAAHLLTLRDVIAYLDAREHRALQGGP